MTDIQLVTSPLRKTLEEDWMMKRFLSEPVKQVGKQVSQVVLPGIVYIHKFSKRLSKTM